MDTISQRIAELTEKLRAKELELKADKTFSENSYTHHPSISYLQSALKVIEETLERTGHKPPYDKMIEESFLKALSELEHKIDELEVINP